MEPINLLPLVNLIKEHVENDSIHALSVITKIGEINPADFNHYEQFSYVKKQFANSIPEGKYIAQLYYKVVEAFTNDSEENITHIAQEGHIFSNSSSNVVINGFNSIQTDIDIYISLSGTNQLSWTAGLIAVYAQFKNIPILNVATRGLTFHLQDAQEVEIANAEIFIDDVSKGFTNTNGDIIFDFTTDECNLRIVKAGYSNFLELLMAGNEDISTYRELNEIIVTTRILLINTFNYSMAPLPEVDIYINEILVGTSDNQGLFIKEDCTTDSFGLVLRKANYTDSANTTIEAGTAQLNLPMVIYNMFRLLLITVNDMNFDPIIGAEIRNGMTLLGLTNDAGIASLPVPTTEFTLNVSKAGYAPYSSLIQPGFESMYPTVVLEVAEQTRPLTLTVWDGNGILLPGADVLINSVIVGLTNGVGVFTHNAPISQFTLGTQKTGFTPNLVNIISAGTEPWTNPMYLTSIIPSRLMRFNIFDINQMPMSLVGVYEGMTLLGQTDMMGSFQMSISQEAHEIDLRKLNFISIHHSISADANHYTNTYTLQAARHLIINVLDSLSQPIEGANIKYNGVSIGYTNINGNHNGSVPITSFSLSIEKTGLEYDAENIDAGTQEFTLNKVMVAAHRHLFLTVIDALQNLIYGAEVYLNGSLAGTTNGNGLIFLEVPEIGFNINIVYPGYEFDGISWGEGTVDITSQQMMLLPHREFTVTITDEQLNPLADVEIFIDNSLIGTTKAGGNLSFAVSENEIALSLRKADFAQIDRVYLAGTIDIGFSGVMTHLREITFLVSDQNFIPLENVEIKINAASIGFTNSFGSLIKHITNELADIQAIKAGYYFNHEALQPFNQDQYFPINMIEVREFNLLVQDVLLNPIADANLWMGAYPIGVTGLDGYCHTMLPKTEATVNVIKNDFITQELIVAAGSSTVDEEMTLLAQPPHRQLTLNVKDDSVNNLDLVEVLIDGIQTGYTNPMGNLVIDVEQDVFTLSLVKTGFSFDPDVIDAGVIDISYDAQMVSLRYMTLTFMDTQEIPMPIVNIEVWRNDILLGSSGAGGIFNYIIPKLTDTILSFRQIDFVTNEQTFAASQFEVIETITMYSTRELILTVKDEDDVLLEGCAVKVNGAGVGSTDSNGVLIVYVPQVEFQLKISLPGHMFVPETIAAGIVDFTLEKVCFKVRTFTIQVNDTDEPANPIIGASIKVGALEIGLTGPTGSCATVLPLTETTVAIVADTYTDGEVVVIAGTDPVIETVALSHSA